MALISCLTPSAQKHFIAQLPANRRRVALAGANPAMVQELERIEGDPRRIKRLDVDTAVEAVGWLAGSALLDDIAAVETRHMVRHRLRALGVDITEDSGGTAFDEEKFFSGTLDRICARIIKNGVDGGALGRWFAGLDPSARRDAAELLYPGTQRNDRLAGQLVAEVVRHDLPASVLFPNDRYSWTMRGAVSHSPDFANYVGPLRPEASRLLMLFPDKIGELPASVALSPEAAAVVDTAIETWASSGYDAESAEALVALALGVSTGHLAGAAVLDMANRTTQTTLVAQVARFARDAETALGLASRVRELGGDAALWHGKVFEVVCRIPDLPDEFAAEMLSLANGQTLMQWVQGEAAVPYSSTLAVVVAQNADERARAHWLTVLGVVKLTRDLQAFMDVMWEHNPGLLTCFLGPRIVTSDNWLRHWVCERVADELTDDGWGVFFSQADDVDATAAELVAAVEALRE